MGPVGHWSAKNQLQRLLKIGWCCPWGPKLENLQRWRALDDEVIVHVQRVRELELGTPWLCHASSSASEPQRSAITAASEVFKFLGILHL